MKAPKPIMDRHHGNLAVSVFRGGRLALHFFYGLLLAVPYPHLDKNAQRRVMKIWSKQLLAILNIGIRIEGQQPPRGEGGCLLVANHVSWLDIYVLNVIHPAQFIAKSEVRNWPVIGWLAKRCGTIFIARALRQNASSINRQVGLLLQQGACIGLFPEGTTTDGKQVGHFHSALIQPAIDAGAKVCPMALRYQRDNGESGSAAAFIGETTLIQSVWRILRCRHLNALVVFTPVLVTAGVDRRSLARTAQIAIAQGLQNAGITLQADEPQTASAFPQALLSSQSAYASLVDPLLHRLHK